MRSPEIRFCIQCGARLEHIHRVGKTRPVCPNCDWTYFPDPKVAVGVLVEDGESVLLVRRSMEPHRGEWTLPGGFLDAGEDPQEAAQREALEETNLQVRILELLQVVSGREHARGAHLVLIYRAEVIGGEMQAGDDADEVAFFDRNALPLLAFRATRMALGVDKDGK